VSENSGFFDFSDKYSLDTQANKQNQDIVKGLVVIQAIHLLIIVSLQKDKYSTNFSANSIAVYFFGLHLLFFLVIFQNYKINISIFSQFLQLEK
jgi:hypothetical protein